MEEDTKALEIDPDFAIAYATLALAWLELDRLEEASSALQRAAERKLEIPDLLVARYDIAFLRGDKVGMEHAVDPGRGKPDAEGWLTDHEALALAYSGRAPFSSRLSLPPSSLFGVARKA